LAQSTCIPLSGPLGVCDPPGEHHRGRQQRHRQDGLDLAACQKELAVSFNTAAALVHELLEARGEKVRLQLAVIDELGYVFLQTLLTM
jgi:hypothetical protein